MGETPEFLLLGGVIFMIVLAVGVFVVTLVYFQRAQAKKRPQQSAPRVQPQTQHPRAQAVPTQDAEIKPAIPVTEMPARAGEVMRVIRDDQTGRVLVEVEGQRYAHIREITNAKVGRRVLWAIADLIRFTGGMAANPQAVRSVSQAQTQSAPRPTSRPTFEQTPATSSPTQGFPPGGTSQPPASVPFTPPIRTTPVRRAETPQTAAQEFQPKRERYSLIGFFRKGFESQEPTTSDLGSGSFIDEIEEILQGYIQNLPAPLPYEVHVTTGENGMLQIEVGKDTYGNPDQVPDPRARQLIKAAVAEWEKR